VLEADTEDRARGRAAGGDAQRPVAVVAADLVGLVPGDGGGAPGEAPAPRAGLEAAVGRLRVGGEIEPRQEGPGALLRRVRRGRGLDQRAGVRRLGGEGERAQRRALGHDAAVAELRRCAGTQFDPGVVEAALRVVGRAAEPPPEALLAARAAVAAAAA
jgi:hypothetical protein